MSLNFRLPEDSSVLAIFQMLLKKPLDCEKPFFKCPAMLPTVCSNIEQSLYSSFFDAFRTSNLEVLKFRNRLSKRSASAVHDAIAINLKVFTCCPLSFLCNFNQTILQKLFQCAMRPLHWMVSSLLNSIECY